MPLGLVLPPLIAPQPAQLEHMALLLELHQALHVFCALLEPTTLALELGGLERVHHAQLEPMAQALEPRLPQPARLALLGHTILVLKLH
jgi:hypothetical protein